MRLALAKILALRGQHLGDYIPNVVACFYALVQEHVATR